MQIEKLSCENFSSWSVQMKSLLISLDYWSVIESAHPVGAKPEEYAAWKSIDNKALATILLSVKPSELQYVKECRSAKEAWYKLLNTYQAKGPVRKVNLFKKLVRFQFNTCEKFSIQINNFCAIASDLKQIDVNMPEELLSILLLCSLPIDLENFVVAIESRDSLPSLENLKIKILEEEQRRGDSVVTTRNMCLI